MRPDRAASMRAGSADAIRIARQACAVLAATVVIATGVAHAADPSKVLRHVFPAAETGFDPAGVQDLYSATIEQMLFETLLTYDYLARPSKLVPLTAEALPEVTDDGKTYTVRVRKGIYFIDDPVFKGRKRELTAADYAYSLKRLIDPEAALAVGVARRGQDRRARRRSRKRRRRPASSTTTRRSKASRRPTATRCASGSRTPTTTCRTSSRTSRRRRSRAK